LLLASASRDRSATIFRVDPSRWSSTGSVQAAEVTQLLTLPNHSAALQCVAIVGAPEVSTAQLAVCTADKLLVLRELEVGPTSAVVRRSHKHIGRSKSWIGLCPHPDRNIFFAACGDRRLLQLDSTGRCQHALRIGGPDAELCAPLRLCQDSKLLALGVAMSGLSSNAIVNNRHAWNPGVLLFDVASGPPKSLALLSGHAEPAAGLAFLGGHPGASTHILTCWGDGAMLGYCCRTHRWDTPLQEDAPPCANRHDIPREHPLQRLTNAEPSFVKPATEAQDSSAGVNGGMKWDPVSEWSPQPVSQKYRDIGVHTAPAKVRCPDALLLERLFSASPPPKWAETSMHDTNGAEETGSNEPSMNLGRWGRDSQVGAQVRSAADLYSMGTFDGATYGAAPASRVASKAPKCANLLAGGDGGPTGSSSERCLRTISTHGVPTRSSSDGNLSSSRNVQLGVIYRTEAEERHSASASSSECVLLAHTRTQSQSCTSLEATASRSHPRCTSAERLRLPPKPRHSPPNCDDPPLRSVRLSAQTVPLQSTEESLRQVEAIVRALRQPQSSEVLAEVGRLLGLESCARDCKAAPNTNSENIPPCQGEANVVHDNGSCSKDIHDVEALRIQLRSLCTQHLLNRETHEVGSLFSRIQFIFARHGTS